MPKPTMQLKGGAGAASANGGSNGDARRSPLSELVHEHLRTRGMRQVDFCRNTGFDQGLLSKILSSVVTTLNVETALKLAEGMGLPPTVVFEAIGKRDIDDLLRRFYCNNDRVMYQRVKASKRCLECGEHVCAPLLISPVTSVAARKQFATQG